MYDPYSTIYIWYNTILSIFSIALDIPTTTYSSVCMSHHFEIISARFSLVSMMNDAAWFPVHRSTKRR